MHDPVSVQLPPAQVAGLLGRLGLTPTTGSPLVELPPAEPPPDDLDLPALRPLLRTVCAPTLQVRTVVIGPDRSISHLHYGDGGATLVGCWSVHDAVHLSGPWEAADVAALAGRALRVAPRGPVAPTAIELTPAGLTALGAAVDALRADLLAGWAAHEPTPPPRLTLQSLTGQLTAGRQHTDARWTVTLLRWLLPGLPDDSTSLARGLDELVDLDLMTPHDDGWSVDPDLLDLAVDWLQPLPAVAIETIRIKADPRRPGVARMGTVAGPGPLWVLTPGDEGRIVLESVDELEWLERVAHLAEPRRPVAAEVPGTTVTWIEVEAPTALLDGGGTVVDELRPGIGTMVEEVVDGWVRCTGAGGAAGWVRATDVHEIGRGAPACRRCGQRADSTDRFCVACGDVLTDRCPTCGSQRVAGEGFCTGCGSPRGAVAGRERRE